MNIYIRCWHPSSAFFSYAIMKLFKSKSRIIISSLLLDTVASFFYLTTIAIITVNQSNNLSKVIAIQTSSINATIPVITVIPSQLKRVQILHFSSRFRCVILVCLVTCG